MPGLPLAGLALAVVAGGAWAPSWPAPLTWGEGVWQGKRQIAAGSYSGAGCAGDVDGDGRADLVVRESGGALVLLRAPRWQRTLIEPQTEFSDCLVASLYGKRGVLLTHMNSQLRFYEYARGEWPYRELYSIYTASAQGGLVLADVDGDGQRDIFVGNYWARNPGARELPWRIFAVNLLHNTPLEALARLALRGRDLVWAESEGTRVLLMRRPEQAEELWTAEPLPGPWQRPKGLLVAPDSAVWVGDRTKVVRCTETERWFCTVMAAGYETLRLVTDGVRIWSITADGARLVPQPRR